MNKMLNKVLIGLLVITVAMAKSLEDHYKSPRVGQGQADDKYQDTTEENPYEGVAPIFGRSLASVFLTDIVNIFA